MEFKIPDGFSQEVMIFPQHCDRRRNLLDDYARSFPLPPERHVGSSTMAAKNPSQYASQPASFTLDIVSHHWLDVFTLADSWMRLDVYHEDVESRQMKQKRVVELKQMCNLPSMEPAASSGKLSRFYCRVEHSLFPSCRKDSMPGRRGIEHGKDWDGVADRRARKYMLSACGSVRSGDRQRFGGELRSQRSPQPLCRLANRDVFARRAVDEPCRPLNQFRFPRPPFKASGVPPQWSDLQAF
ncbi:hypothetical protein C8R45DRAFT_1103656 [Mycena sanguinolenta]|nr:hypothetical protein C8R45DRAFT_1103656 [Mycena sanguinolenta]